MGIYPDDAVGTIDACVDCLCLLANGECDPDTQDEVAERMAANWPAPYSLVPSCGVECCGDESEPWFSWSACEVCKRPEGGDRMHVTWFDESKRRTPFDADRSPMTRTMAAGHMTRKGHTLVGYYVAEPGQFERVECINCT